MTVDWLDFGSASISEPLFFQTIRRLRSNKPKPGEWRTDLSEVTERAKDHEAVEPAGVIFHISRCGSTFVSNVLRCVPDVLVLSEALPIEKPLDPIFFLSSPLPPDEWDQARKQLLRDVSRLYANLGLMQDTGFREPRLVIKCSALNTLNLSLCRAIWPRVPFIVLIRDPVEVMVSNMAVPGGWCRTRDEQNVSGALRLPSTLPIEEWLAKAIAIFCEVALRSVDDQCRIVDYAKLNEETILSIAQYFGLASPDRHSNAFQTALLSYSKDPSGTRVFQADSQNKRSSAGSLVQNAARLWAQEPYERLKACEAASFSPMSRIIAAEEGSCRRLERL